VHVQIATQIPEGDETIQCVPARCFNFAAILAQFWRNPFEPERFVNAFLRVAGETAVVLDAEDRIR
jgi:hypothetical protein